MPQSLSVNDQETFLTRGFSRRQLGRIASALTAGAALPFYNEAAFAQRAMRERGDMSEAVRINSNENPLGPCPEALEAICQVAKFGGRYSPHDEQGELTRTVASLEGLKPDYIQLYAGSSDPLLRVACAFTSPSKSWVMADPGYESGGSTAKFIGAQAHHVALKSDHSHDVKAMVKKDSNAGVIYICNPNNPTGTVTSRADIDYTVANMPKGCLLVVDEAYLHFSTAQTAADLVRADKDVIILRTFSKIYGMAGIRMGMAFGRPDLLAKLKPYGPGFVPITAVAAATASLKVADLVPKRRKINTDILENTLAFLDKKGYNFTKSQANHFMVDVRRPGGDVVAALGKENVIIGRTWPVWPNHVRVSVGTQAEMDQFKAAFAKVMA